MRYLLLLALLLTGCAAPPICVPDRDDSGRIARSRAVLAEFRKTVPCPGTGKIEKRCEGYVIDHIVPLCACGADALDNLQWQTITDAKLKDLEEAKLCRMMKQESAQ